MPLRFSDLVDISAVQGLMDSLWQAAGMPVGIIDMDGTVLVETGQPEICTRFHRQHPVACQRCEERDAYLHQQLLAEKEPLPEGEFVAYHCRNGLVDIAMPIMIDDRHLATLYLGQFFFEPPDEGYFIEQGKVFGFPQEAYLAALRQVPIFSREKVRQILAFHGRLVSLLANMGAETLRRIEAQREMARREGILRRQNQALLHIGMLRALDQGELADLLREILETAANTMEVERASLWRFSADRKRIRCFGLYERSADRHSAGQLLKTADFPSYFQALEEGGKIAVHDIENDPRTRDLVETYLRPAGISSMLDTPVWSGGQMVGIVCCEHVGPARQWSYEEQNFAGSLADLLSLALEGSERRRAERALRESEEKYRLLFSAESDAILVLDARTKNILEANEAATLLYGYGKEEFTHLNVADIIDEMDVARKRMEEVLAGTRTRIPLAFHRKRDGTVFPAEISSGTFRWKGRQRLVGIIRDISERQQMMRIKDELLSTVSHEIRTPLTAILGFADFLRTQTVTPEQQKDYLSIICAEGERLKELTDNLLDLQRWRAGFGTAEFEPVDLRPLLKSVWLLFRQSSPRHEVVLDCPVDLPPVFGDEGQLYRALQNLLSNAIKYSPAGGAVTVGAEYQGEFVHLWVSDRGIGIPSEAREQIFDRFFRLDTGKQWISGTGLGLALVKAVAQGHRGRAWVKSTVGIGSTFYLAIPLLSAWEKLAGREDSQ